MIKLRAWARHVALDGMARVEWCFASASVSSVRSSPPGDLTVPCPLHDRHRKLNHSVCLFKRRYVALLQVSSIWIRPHQLQHREESGDTAQVVRENEVDL